MEPFASMTLKRTTRRGERLIVIRACTMVSAQSQLAFRRGQPAQGYGCRSRRTVHLHPQDDFATVEEDESSWPSCALLIDARLKANLWMSILDSITVVSARCNTIPKVKRHLVQFVPWHPNRCRGSAFDDDRKFCHKVGPLNVKAVGGFSEITPGAIEAKIAHDRGSLAPSWICVADYCGFTSRDGHNRRFIVLMLHLALAIAPLIPRRLVGGRDGDDGGEKKRSGHSSADHHSRLLILQDAPLGSGIPSGAFVSPSSGSGT